MMTQICTADCRCSSARETGSRILVPHLMPPRPRRLSRWRPTCFAGCVITARKRQGEILPPSFLFAPHHLAATLAWRQSLWPVRALRQGTFAAISNPVHTPRLAGRLVEAGTCCRSLAERRRSCLRRTTFHHSRKSPSARVEPERPASRELPSVPRANGSGSIK